MAVWWTPPTAGARDTATNFMRSLSILGGFVGTCNGYSWHAGPGALERVCTLVQYVQHDIRAPWPLPVARTPHSAGAVAEVAMYVDRACNLLFV